MRNKPLKNKVFELDPNAEGKEGSAFWYNDVESAVRGLIEDIEYSKFATSKHLQDDIRKEITELIKKWFPDVVKENE